MPIPARGILSRLSDHTPEIFNALITANFPRVASIIADAGPEVLDKARPNLNQLLEDILVQIAADGRFDSDERSYIQSFVKAAAIPKPECQRIYARAMKRALSRVIDESIADNHLDDDEFNRITELAKRPQIRHAHHRDRLENPLRIHRQQPHRRLRQPTPR